MRNSSRSRRRTGSSTARRLVLDADPLADIGDLARVHRTIIRGSFVYDPDELMESIC